MPSHARRHQLRGSLIYHAYNRSNAGNVVFHDDADFLKFMGLLRRYSESFFMKIYHWVIMATHFHVLLELADPRLISRIMAGITVVYTRYHHARYATHGYLWQGRFKLQAVQKERYLVACGRYIERNPVKAGICTKASDYPFSSARFYTRGIADNITSEDPTFVNFGSDPVSRRENYRVFLCGTNSEEEELFGRMEEHAGSAIFIERLKRINGRPMPWGKGKRRRTFLDAIASPQER